MISYTLILVLALTCANNCEIENAHCALINIIEGCNLAKLKLMIPF